MDLKEGEVLEGIGLHGVADGNSISEQMKNRTFRVTVLNDDGQPVPKQQLWLSSQHRMSLNLEPLAGDRKDFANRMKPYEQTANTLHRTGGDGRVDLPGGWPLFGDYDMLEIVVAVNGEKAEGAVGFIHADLKTPEITMRMTPLCEVSIPISTDELPPSDETSEIELFSKSRLVVSQKSVRERFVVQLPVGEYEMTVAHALANSQEVKFAIKPGNPTLALEPIQLKPSHLAKLLGQPAPEFRNIEEWKFGNAVRLEELRGKIVVLAFWDRSYHGWENSVPTLKKLRQAYPDEDVVIIGVFNNFWLKQLTRVELWNGQDLPFRVALADSSTTTLDGVVQRIQGRVMHDYGITRFPTTLLIDQQGNVSSLQKSDEFDGICRQIDNLLGR